MGRFLCQSFIQCYGIMRLFILFLALACVPVMVAVHLVYFLAVQEPDLKQRAAAILQRHGIRTQRVDLRFWQLSIAGNATDPEAASNARAELASTAPWELETDSLVVPARLSVVQEKNRLKVSGWLPTQENTHQAGQLLATLRPDLTLDLADLHHDSQVRWPEGEAGPLSAASSLVKPWLDDLRVKPWLQASRDSAGQIEVSGMLPADGTRARVMQALFLEEKEVAGLQESLHTVTDGGLADSRGLADFLRDYFSAPGARSFRVNERGESLLVGPLTRSMEVRWLAALRPVFGGRRVEFQGQSYPSEYHMPGRVPESPLPPAQLTELSQMLSALRLSFSPRSFTPGPLEQASLAALAGQLVSAGPSLRLVIGGHPEPWGDAISAAGMAKERARQVLAILVEQGLPTQDVKIMAFDPVEGDMARPAEVEILIR